MLTRREEQTLGSFLQARSDDYWKAKSLLYYRSMFGHLGKNSWLRAPMMIRYARNIYIGDGCMIRDGARLEVVKRSGHDPGQIRIGNNVTMEQGAHIASATVVELADEVCLAPRCVIVDTTHPLGQPEDGNRARVVATEDSFVRLERRVFLGAHVIVLPNVTIGENTVVGAGSVVSRDLPPNVIAAGAPAAIIREIR